MTLSISNLRYVEPSQTLIDMDVTRDGETFPFTYSPTDPEEVSVAVRSLLARGEYEIAPYDAPSPPVPQSVSSMQAKVALSRAGLLQTVEAWVASESGETRLIWNSATVFSRESGLIASAAAALGLTSEQVDDLFRSAAIIDP